MDVVCSVLPRYKPLSCLLKNFFLPFLGFLKYVLVYIIHTETCREDREENAHQGKSHPLHSTLCSLSLHQNEYIFITCAVVYCSKEGMPICPFSPGAHIKEIHCNAAVVVAAAMALQDFMYISMVCVNIALLEPYVRVANRTYHTILPCTTQQLTFSENFLPFLVLYAGSI